MKILHIISGLSGGGAEKVLFNICVNDKKNKHIVVSLTDLGVYGLMLKRLKIETHYFDLRSKIFFIKNLYLLYKFISVKEPEIVQTWMYHADLIGGLIAKLAKCKNIFWNIRQSNFLSKGANNSTFFLALACAKISSWLPKKIICNSSDAKKNHVKYGYNYKKFVVIHNGIDTKKFFIKLGIKKKIRKVYKINDGISILGTIARYDPYKDFKNLFSALSILKKKNTKFIYFIAGKNIDNKNIELVNLINSYNLKKNIFLLGFKKNLNNIINSLDLFILPSRSESFPNVIAEAMACGVPCISTKVGEVKNIIGNKGWVVNPRSPKLLANGILAALKDINNKRYKMNSANVRSHIVKNYNIKKMIKEYQIIWQGETK